MDSWQFTELDPWVRNRCLDFGLSDMELTNEGVIAGWGDTGGAFIFANDFTVMEVLWGSAGSEDCRLLDHT